MKEEHRNWLEDIFDKGTAATFADSEFSLADSEREKIAEGGMKTIYRCRDRITGREVALALLKDPQAPGNRERFLREALIVANLQHPNIVPLYSVAIDGPEGPSFTMKLLGGQTLTEAIAYPMPRPTLLDAFVKICDAVSYAHHAGIIHLDLKPDNVHIGEFGELLVCDWGLAGFVTNDDSDDLRFYERPEFQAVNQLGFTLHGEVRGTPGFMAPEQAAGDGAVKDERTDVYALGATLYAILTKQPPLQGHDLHELINRTKTGDIPPPSSIAADVPTGLEAVCVKAMSVNPDDRYQTVNALAAEVQAYDRGYAPVAEQASLARQVLLLVNRNRRFFATVGCAVVIIAVLGIASVRSLQEGERRARAAAAAALQSEAEAKALLAEVERQEAVRQRLGENLEERLQAQIPYQYLEQNYGKLKRLIDAQLELDPGNEQALLFKARMHFIQQEFADFLATAKLLADPHRFASKIDFLKAREKPTAPLSVGELMAAVGQVDDTEVERLLGQAFADGLPITGNLDLIDAGFRIRNSSLKSGQITWDPTQSSMTLRDCRSLENISFLYKLPIQELDLHQAQLPESALLQLPRVRAVTHIVVAPDQLPESVATELSKQGRTLRIAPQPATP